MQLFKTTIILLTFFNITIAQECKSILEIRTNKQNAFIYLNNKLIGNGNITINLTPNLYQVLVRESIYKWNSSEIIDTIKIEGCNKKYFVNYNLHEKKFIDSSPQDAMVSLLGKVIGYTPTYVDLENYDSLEVIKENNKLVIHKNDLSKLSLIKLDYKPNVNNRSFSDSEWFKILIGSAAIFGTTAAYFKIKADKKYDEYLLTKDKNTLTEVNRLDLYSGIAFGLLQINFGYLIYKFLIE